MDWRETTFSMAWTAMTPSAVMAVTPFSVEHNTRFEAVIRIIFSLIPLKEIFN